MFDVGFWELLIIGVIALIVVGPERLPGFVRTVGLWVGRARATFYSIRDEIEHESHMEGLRETQRALRESERRIREGAERTASEVRSEAERARDEVDDAVRRTRTGDGSDANSPESGEQASEEFAASPADDHSRESSGR